MRPANISRKATLSLGADDRCDRCGAPAYVQVVLDQGTLLFCAHHFVESEAPLRATARVVHDERHRLRHAS